MQLFINPDKSTWEELIRRPEINFRELENSVRQIFEEVKLTGDKAVRRYTHFFDEVDLEDIEIPQAVISSSRSAIPGELALSIEKAAENIRTFHKAQLCIESKVETRPGVVCWRETRPIESVGLYVPGGSAPLFSSVLMLAIPAEIAGCNEIILCTPPQKIGAVNPAILFAASLVKNVRVFSCGGIQAVAAMACGTESIPRVNKIFGPGNQYVTLAKQLSQLQGVAIDMPAGPSELLIIADKTAKPEFLAADLLSQAEHGPDSQVLLVTTRIELIDATLVELDKMLPGLPRAATAQKALLNSKAIVLNNSQEVIEFSNRYAPEHLIIASAEEEFYIEHIVNAGSVFLGNFSPESAGDYASGTNHTLPTNGFARAYSGVSLDSFVKKVTFQRLTKKGLIDLAPVIETMAEAEGLLAHKNAVTIRMKDK